MLLDLPSSHAEVLARMARWGVEFGSFFDVGAAEGTWGELVREHWPGAEVHLFEAAPAWRAPLEARQRSLGGVTDVTIAAVGERDGSVEFRYDEANPYGGSVVQNPGEEGISVPEITLDTYVAKRRPRAPFALKLDVHGAEQSILAGGGDFMRACDFVIFETYNFGPATRRFGQMAVLLEERYGLRCIDMAEPKWRPFDGALWQLDLYFVRPGGTTLAEWRL